MHPPPPDILATVIFGTVILLGLVIFIVSFLLLYQRKQFAHQQEKEQLRISFEQEMLQARLEMQEQTQRQIAYEIHDNVGQVLSVVRLYLNGMALQQNNEPLRQRLLETNQLTGKAINDLRELSHSLNSDYFLQNGLAESLRIETERITRSRMIQASFEQNGIIPEIPDDKALILFRIVQELITNAIRHAQAKQLQIRIEITSGQLQIVVQDDGVGFSLEATTGSGLLNIKRRAALIGATLQFISENRQGTKAMIIFPVS